MLKKLLQELIPSPILTYYKKARYYKTIKKFKIEDEPDLIVVQKLLSPKDTILDIGANIGLYIHFLSTSVKRIVGFEPVPFTFSILENNAKLFEWDNIELHQAAISDTNGQAIIQVPIQAGVRNYFRATLTNNIDVSSDMSFEVKTQTLDSYLSRQSDTISFIKCDTEGHELSVVKGAFNFLNENKPAWLIEISGNPDEPDSESAELFSIMKSYGYKVYFFKDSKLQKRNPGDESVNYFFLQDTHLETLTKQGIEIDI